MRYFRRGVSSAIFVPTIANQDAPTAAELTAGTDLSAAVNSISGFTTDVSRISEPVLKYKQNLQASGEQTFGDAAMKLMEGDGQAGPDETILAAAYTALADGVIGYIVLAPGATDATSKVEVWPVEVSANNRDWTLDNAFAKYDVSYAITGAPSKNAVVAA